MAMAEAVNDESDESTERTELGDQLVQAQQVMETTLLPQFTKELLTIPLTIQQLKVLAILGTEPEGNTVQALAASLEVSLATMSGIIDRLTNQHMVTRVHDPHDQRVRRVVVTDLGKQTVRGLLAAQPHVEPRIIAALELDDLRALVQGVEALVRAISQNA